MSTKPSDLTIKLDATAQITNQDESSTPLDGNGDVNQETELSSSLPRNPSRFQVNKVEGGDVSETTMLNAEPEPPTPGTPGSARGVHFNVGEQVEGAVGAGQANAATYGTTNFKSFQAVQTVEKIPHADHYRNVMSLHGAIASSRPTIQQLLQGERFGQEAKKRASTVVHMQHFERFGLDGDNGLENAKHLEPASTGQKFGWIKGVLMRCILSILGTMLYLRISWVAGAAGLGFGTLVIFVSAVVVTITSISMCAICTNGEIRGGGAYYMISRSLGPEFGGAIGLIFSLGNAVSAAMCVIGFAEVLRDMLKYDFGISMIDGDLNDVRIIGYATLLLILCITFVGVSFEAKAQVVLMAVLALSLVDYIIGTFIGTNEEKSEKGMTGYSWQTMKENFLPDWRGESFFSVFAVFFPACTGIMAGANISGDLADPQKAIPKGTLWAILICMVIYAAAVWTTGCTFVREVLPGNITELLVNCTTGNSTDTVSEPTLYGLLHNYQVLEISGAWRPLVTAGIYAATLSSALAAFVSAPKVFQAVCKDRLFPYIYRFGKGYGPNDEPRQGYALTFVLAIGFVSIGTLNDIATIISNFYLMCYALVNYACFEASFARSPGFRPGFHYYNMWVSLAGAVMCLAVMFIISWWNALLTFGCVAALYIYVLYRKPDVNWGSSTQAHAYKSALQAALKVASRPEHVKNYRPQILILTGNPVARPALVDFASNITKETSLLVCGHVVPLAPNARVIASIEKLSRQIYEWFDKRNVKAFYVGVARSNMRDGVQCILQVTGLGRIKPNVVLLGFKNNWKDTAFQDQSNDDYFNIIHDSFENNCGVGILRLQNGLDVSEMMSVHKVGDTQKLKFPEPSNLRNIDATGSGTTLMDSSRQLAMENITGSQQFTRVRTDTGRKSSSSSIPEKILASATKSINQLSFTKSSNSEMDPDEEGNEVQSTLLNDDVIEENEDEETVVEEVEDEERPSTPPPIKYLRTRRMTKQQKEVIHIMDQFKIKVKKAIVHVFWLFDDGGLGLLVPHLLTMPRSYLEGAKLKVYTVAASRSQLEREQRSMAALLSRFRIEYSDVLVIPDLANKPKPETIKEFEAFISEFREHADTAAGENGEENEKKPENPIPSRGRITDAEYNALRIKTYRQLRIREILLRHSSEATLIVVTLPVPRRGILTSSLYLAWLDFITRNLPPVLLLRGNQQSVLTFYS